jgi:hypothetical protein
MIFEYPEGATGTEGMRVWRRIFCWSTSWIVPDSLGVNGMRRLPGRPGGCIWKP